MNPTYAMHIIVDFRVAILHAKFQDVIL